MFELRKTPVSLVELKRRYAEGERDFTGIVCTGVDFSKTDLSGCDFTGSNLSYNNFKSANLSDCNFTNTNLRWSGLERADLRNSDFTKADCSYTSFNKAKMEGTILHKTDLSYSFLYDVDRDKLDLKTAVIYTAAFHPSEVTEEGKAHVAEEMKKMKGNIHFETFHRLEFIVKHEWEIAGKSINVEDRKSAYGATESGEHVSYGTGGGGAHVGYGAGGSGNVGSYTTSNEPIFGTIDPLTNVKKKKNAYQK